MVLQLGKIIISNNMLFVPNMILAVIEVQELRASPLVHSMLVQTVQFIVKKSKCVGLAQEIHQRLVNMY
jgi:hypothetical protein